MQQAKESILARDLFAQNDKILVAVSGGIDSMAMAHWMHDQGYSIGIAHVNYHLRGSDSDLDEELVRSFSKSQSIPFHLLQASKPDKVNTQTWARNERYAFFDSLFETEGYTIIATAHHLDDQFETVFMNLLRGSGTKGLRGIPRKRGQIVRPLLDLSRVDIEAYVEKHNVPYRSDSSNATLDYTRNQIRHKLMPLLDEIGQNSRPKLKRSIELLRDDFDAISTLATSLVKSTSSGFRVELDSIPSEVRQTWLYHAIHDFNFNRAQCSGILQGSNGAIIESETHIAVLQGNHVIVQVRDVPPISIVINETGSYPSEGSYLILSEGTFNHDLLPKTPAKIWMDTASLVWPLNWTTVASEDHIKPVGSDYSCNVLKYLKDRGIDRLTRPRIMVLKDALKNIVCIPGIQVAQNNRCRDTTKSFISVELL